MNDSIVFYRSFHEAAKMLEAQEYKEAMNGILTYAFDGEIPEFKSTSAEIIFTLVKPQIDANAKRKADGCKGGRPKTTGYENEKPLVIKSDENEKPNVNVNDNVNVNNKKNNIKKSQPQKHKQGDYQHVLLTDAEDQKLIEEFGKDIRDKAIDFLDKYIEEKKYKSNSHYLAIRRWVVDAVNDADQRKNKQQPKTNSKVHDYNERQYDYDELLKDLM